MQQFAVGDIVVVREDLTAEEKSLFPHFVLEMEKYVGHMYSVTDNNGFHLRKCDADRYAPDPDGWGWHEAWCRPVKPEAEDELDFSAVFDLV